MYTRNNYTRTEANNTVKVVFDSEAKNTVNITKVVFDFDFVEQDASSLNIILTILP